MRNSFWKIISIIIMAALVSGVAVYFLQEKRLETARENFLQEQHYLLTRIEKEELKKLTGVICTEEYNPTCGADGITYGNGCNAYASGVNVKHEGKCSPAEQPSKITSDMCNEKFVPACGSDGKLYINGCFARAAGVHTQDFGMCK